MSLKATYERVLKKVSLVYNILLLLFWLYVLALIAFHFYFHLHNGFKLDFSLLDSLDLWYYISREFKAATVFNSLNLLFVIGSKKNSKPFLTLLFHHSKGFLLYFVTFNLLNEDANVKWTLINLALWNLLNIMETLNTMNNNTLQKNEFLEWFCYKVFVFIYPLLSVSELILVTSSFRNLMSYDKYKSFPSPMPNKYNFSVNLQMVYKVMPAPLGLFSTMVYFYKCKNSL